MEEIIDDLFPKKDPVFKSWLKDNAKVDLYLVNK
jgi:hypothetical protein